MASVFERLFGREKKSAHQAKERLQLVLIHDRINVSPVLLDKLKDELITVISRYVEIDASAVEVTFTQSRSESRLVADIPVIGPVRPAATRGARGTTGAGD